MPDRIAANNISASNHRFTGVQAPEKLVSIGLVCGQPGISALRLGIARGQAGDGKEIRRGSLEYALQLPHLGREPGEEPQGQRPALISVHMRFLRRRWVGVKSFSCSSFAETALSGKIAGFLRISGLMYFTASRFGLPDPIRLVSSAEFLPRA